MRAREDQGAYGDSFVQTKRRGSADADRISRRCLKNSTVIEIKTALSTGTELYVQYNRRENNITMPILLQMIWL